MLHSVNGEGVVMGLWGHFLPYWEMSAEVEQGCPEAWGRAWRLLGARGALAGGCPAQTVTRPIQDLCRPAVAFRGLLRVEAPSLVSVLLGKTGANRQALLASCADRRGPSWWKSLLTGTRGKLIRGKQRQ